ncbi:2-phospho-L-lactate guanylyltransferase [Longispora sp. NPDC051575]|uniref:2-phospho-L-lactate guanylyltransferase n=1 Tax=Longispora sp. NPDC051575 TaxID=3154943 RepID=UPI0034307A68
MVPGPRPAGRDTPGGGPWWSVVVPVKRAALGKSRLRGAVPWARHEDLARALALDTVAAVVACAAVRRVLVVTDDEELRAALPPGVLVTADPGELAADLRGMAAGLGGLPGEDGLNTAIRHGQAALGPRTGPTAALTADLPALRPAELAAALAAALGHRRCHVTDAAGTGTTLLASAGPLDPLFGPGSAAAHVRSGAVALSGDWPSLRRDVDTAADLGFADALGLGRWTRAVIGRRAADQVSP